MTRSKTLDPICTAAGFHALSDATRIEIVDLLRGGERCVCELMDTLDAAQSRLSFHLKVLREAGLVTDRRDGRWVYYTLNTDSLGEMEEFLSHLRAGGVVASARGAARTACCN
ncbi:MAG TPA: metalloregulator ArsR/SmtB family transcription factor [Gemmatimonadaceae bacterium]|jgi:ArsR family transcriptional regulator|nr:metalloregulator ArsR/SmtB family transcription factor [Gemmatimonadaceae bacterium]